MNKQDAKKIAYRQIWVSVEGELDRALCGVIDHMTDADRGRVVEAYDEICQSLYNRSCGNIQRARGA